MLIDTDVLIWYLRGNLRAAEVIENSSSFSMSAVSYMELVQGMRNKAELNLLRRTLREWNTEIISLNAEITAKAIVYVEQHFLSHAVQVADALIAASAIHLGQPLLTANDKHYRVIKELQCHVFRP
ncbi:MAG: type II toxin-antitoxin system VapC family toxin [Deltaproteobacteria bacterium]|nr:type II toxin-antitoxin system VapC family toxin [Deltaproteobacteria bacterium]